MQKFEDSIKVPFHREYHFDMENGYIYDVIKNRNTSADGYYTDLAEKFLKNKFGYSEVFMTTSCTHALEMAVLLLDIKQGDEVIMPSFNFPSAANAVVLRGAMPVFAEINPLTMNISPQDFKRNITKKTKAVIVMHYAGIACDMDKIMEIASEKGIYVIEDAAQGADAKYKGRYLGGIGDIGCLSFHGTKNHIAGEAGAIILKNKNDEWKNKIEIIRQKGTNRNDMLRGSISKYEWVDKGSSYCPSELLMAMLCAQLENKDVIRKKRKEIFEIYSKGMESIKNKNEYCNIDYIMIPEGSDSNYHIFYILTKTEHDRELIQKKLESKGIQAFFHFSSLHSSPMGKKLGYKNEDLSLTESMSKRLLRLPLYTGLSIEQANYVINTLEEIITEMR